MWSRLNIINFYNTVFNYHVFEFVINVGNSFPFDRKVLVDFDRFQFNINA